MLKQTIRGLVFAAVLLPAAAMAQPAESQPIDLVGPNGQAVMVTGVDEGRAHMPTVLASLQSAGYRQVANPEPAAGDYRLCTLRVTSARGLTGICYTAHQGLGAEVFDIARPEEAATLLADLQAKYEMVSQTLGLKDRPNS